MSIKDCRKMNEYICGKIRSFTDIAVVGLSGGADSTLVATLCTEALGITNVYGVSMPYNKFDIENFNARSTRLAAYLGLVHHWRSIDKIADAIDESIAWFEHQPTDLNKGNSRSRARMCVLYGFAHTLGSAFPGKKVRVMGTGNLSEDFIGYDTKGGDALADIFPIGELYKSEVYQMLEYFRDKGVIKEEHIDRVPSAGLENGQTDEGDLGYTYNEMEPAIKFCRENHRFVVESSIEKGVVDKIFEFVWKRHMANKHKHEAPPVLSLRNLID